MRCTHETKILVRNQDDEVIAWTCARCQATGLAGFRCYGSAEREPPRFCDCGQPARVGDVCDRCRFLDGQRASAAAVISAIREVDDGAGVSVRDVADVAGVSVRHAIRVLRVLQRRGRVTRRGVVDELGTDEPARYWLDGGRL